MRKKYGTNGAHEEFTKKIKAPINEWCENANWKERKNRAKVAFVFYSLVCCRFNTTWLPDVHNLQDSFHFHHQPIERVYDVSPHNVRCTRCNGEPSKSEKKKLKRIVFTPTLILCIFREWWCDPYNHSTLPMLTKSQFFCHREITLEFFRFSFFCFSFVYSICHLRACSIALPLLHSSVVFPSTTRFAYLSISRCEDQKNATVCQ